MPSATASESLSQTSSPPCPRGTSARRRPASREVRTRTRHTRQPHRILRARQRPGRGGDTRASSFRTPFRAPTREARAGPGPDDSNSTVVRRGRLCPGMLLLREHSAGCTLAPCTEAWIQKGLWAIAGARRGRARGWRSDGLPTPIPTSPVTGRPSAAQQQRPHVRQAFCTVLAPLCSHWTLYEHISGPKRQTIAIRGEGSFVRPCALPPGKSTRQLHELANHGNAPRRQLCQQSSLFTHRGIERVL